MRIKKALEMSGLSTLYYKGKKLLSIYSAALAGGSNPRLRKNGSFAGLRPRKSKSKSKPSLEPPGRRTASRYALPTCGFMTAKEH